MRTPSFCLARPRGRAATGRVRGASPLLLACVVLLATSACTPPPVDYLSGRADEVPPGWGTRVAREFGDVMRFKATIGPGIGAQLRVTSLVNLAAQIHRGQSFMWANRWSRAGAERLATIAPLIVDYHHEQLASREAGVQYDFAVWKDLSEPYDPSIYFYRGTYFQLAGGMADRPVLSDWFRLQVAVHALLLGVDVEFRPSDLLDAFATMFGLDPMGDGVGQFPGQRGY